MFRSDLKNKSVSMRRHGHHRECSSGDTASSEHSWKGSELFGSSPLGSFLTRNEPVYRGSRPWKTKEYLHYFRIYICTNSDMEELSNISNNWLGERS